VSAALAGLLAAAAAWLAVPVPAARRLRGLATSTSGVSRPSPTAVVLVLTPLACLLILGPVAGSLVAVVVTPIARSALGSMTTAAARRREEQLRAQLPVALDLVVSVLASGRPAVVALEVVGEVSPDPVGPELSTVALRLRAGGDPGAVWEALVAHPVLGTVGRAFRRAEQSGSPVAAVLAATSVDLRRDRSSRARERARAVGVRTAAPLGLCFLPAFFCIGIVPTLVGVASRLDLVVR
jgi:Flp pilus assembly protein TadB